MLLTDNIRLGRIKRYSLAEQAYRYLKDQILSGQIRQGDVITEQAIADQLHMSRTPVKNAISRLETENFVTTMNGRGTLVNVLSIADMRDIYSVRCALGELALDTAVKNLPLRRSGQPSILAVCCTSPRQTKPCTGTVVHTPR